jgi:hypothetical protein
MEISLQNILFEYFLKNNLDHEIEQFYILDYDYNKWKKTKYTDCSSCKKNVKKEYICQTCEKYYYCLECFDNYTYYCFFCNKHHCFVCNVKRRACVNCYYS